MEKKKSSSENGFWWAVLFFVAVAALVFFTLSCNQEEPPEPVTKISIFVSSSPSSDGLKSATPPTPVIEGDTIFFPRDVPVLMWATNENGLAVKGNWDIRMMKSEFSFTPSSFNPIGTNFIDFGDQTARAFPEIGIYRVSFISTNNSQIVFYVKIYGNPGKVGDDEANNFIFRMENKTVRNTTTYELHNLTFVYFKYAGELEPGQAYCYLKLFLKNGSERTEALQMMKWPFGQDYYYFVIYPDQKQELTGHFQAIFIVSKTGGFSGYLDSNNQRSSWWTKYGIQFGVPQN